MRDFRMNCGNGGAGNSLHIGKPHLPQGAGKSRSRKSPPPSSEVVRRSGRGRTAPGMRDFRMNCGNGGAGNSLHIGKPHLPQGAGKSRSRKSPPPSSPANKKRAAHQRRTSERPLLLPFPLHCGKPFIRPLPLPPLRLPRREGRRPVPPEPHASSRQREG